MKNIKSILSWLFILSIVVFVTSCKKNKNNDDNNGTTKKYVPTEMTIRESGTSSQATWNFTYNSNRQITQMKSTNATSTGTYDLFYLDNGNLDYFNQQFTGSPSSTISLKYDSGLRLIQLSTNGTPDVNFAHTVGNNIYTATLLSSSESFDIDFDENNNLQGYYSGTDSVVISYLSDQPGVFANVTLNPSVIIPFHILPYSYEIYYLHANQIAEIKGLSFGDFLYSDYQRDANGNLTSFRMVNSAGSVIYTISYELK